MQIVLLVALRHRKVSLNVFLVLRVNSFSQITPQMHPRVRIVNQDFSVFQMGLQRAAAVLMVDLTVTIRKRRVIHAPWVDSPHQNKPARLAWPVNQEKYSRLDLLVPEVVKLVVCLIFL